MNRESELMLPSRRRGGLETICGNCQYHRRGDGRFGDGWICVCDTSAYNLNETDYRFSCPDFEPRAKKRL